MKRNICVLVFAGSDDRVPALDWYPALTRTSSDRVEKKRAIMVLRVILGYLTRNEQLIQKLADSYPMRRAAQMTAFLFFKGKEIGEESIDKLKESDTVNKLKQEARITGDRFGTFTKEVKDGFKEISDDVKKRQR